MLLAGDIGGTKTHLAVFVPANGPRRPLVEDTFPSSRYASLEKAAQAFLSRVDVPVKRACFGVAGPVVEGRATVTNLPWEMHDASLAEILGLERVHLLNDLESVANAIPLLGTEDLHVLNEGAPLAGGAIAVIAPGTGLGEAFLTWNGGGYDAHPSEGGHCDFAPGGALEMGLLRHLQGIYGHVSWERVCSGLGIPNIYAYLKDTDQADEPAWLADQLAGASDPTPVIVAHGLDGERRCPLCEKALQVFVSALGAEAGNLALKTLATAGVYLGGGIPPRILPILDEGGFVRRFVDKGRLGGLMERVPVYVILNPEAALLGAARYGLEAMA